MWWCCQALVRRAQRDTDTPEELARKELWVPIFAVLSPLAAIFLFVFFEGFALIDEYGFALSTVGASVGFVWPLCSRRLSLEFVAVVGLTIVVSVLLIDINTAASSGSFRPWTFVILVMDIYLALDVPVLYQHIALQLTSLWILFSYIETAYRLGLYDIERFTEEPEAILELCNCSNPPCAMGLEHSVRLFPVLVILFGDYFATRGFAQGLRSEKSKVVASVRVSEQVAQLLAAYATSDARRVVAEEGAALPDALRNAYEQLLDNLDSYRVYLPDSLLYATQRQRGADADEHESEIAATAPAPRAPPGLGIQNAEVAVCFTDIQSSTELWENFPLGMYAALNLHNDFMREVNQACNGYEVKTIGDSFMLAFDCAAEAARFGLEAQQGLLRQQWPDDLLSHPLCQTVTDEGQLIWRGLRVRIGIQSGPVRVERNPVTGRSDYFGHTVNTAARLEAVLRRGGLVATTDTVVEVLGSAGLSQLGSPVLRDMGDMELKGVRGLRKVWALAPQGLKARLAIFEAPSTPASRVRRNSRTSSRWSGGSASTRGGARAGRGRGSITLRLQQTSTTCAAARAPLCTLTPVSLRMPSFVASAALAADQTQGVVDCVLSACVLVSWNSSRPCAEHPAACRQFLRASFRGQPHLGAAAGGAFYGSVAAGRRSFATVIGGCVELAAALAEEAERCGDTALVSGAVAEECAAAGTAFCAQLWQARGAAPIVVHEVQADDGEEDKWLLSGSGVAIQADGANACLENHAPSALFVRACSAKPGTAEQEEVLRELDQLGTTVAAKLRARVMAGTARCRPMPPLWDPEPVAARTQSCMPVPLSPQH